MYVKLKAVVDFLSFDIFSSPNPSLRNSFRRELKRNSHDKKPFHIKTSSGLKAENILKWERADKTTGR